MATVKVVTESSVKPSYIQIDIPLGEAKLLVDGHVNITDVLKSDIASAVEYVESRLADKPRSDDEA